jgi:hypothetical protein
MKNTTLLQRKPMIFGAESLSKSQAAIFSAPSNQED